MSAPRLFSLSQECLEQCGTLWDLSPDSKQSIDPDDFLPRSGRYSRRHLAREETLSKGMTDKCITVFKVLYLIDIMVCIPCRRNGAETDPDTMNAGEMCEVLVICHFSRG